MKKPPHYQIKVHKGKWTTVALVTFRSWTGERRLNGKRYDGPVYYLGTDRVAPRKAAS